MELFKGENKKTMDKNKIEIQRLTANLETIRQSRFQYQNMVFQYDMDVEYFTTLLQEISTKKVLLLSIIMEASDSWADDYNDDVKRLYSEVKKSYKETVDFFSELHKMATDKLNEAKIIQSNKNILSQNSIEDPQNDNLHQKSKIIFLEENRDDLFNVLKNYFDEKEHSELKRILLNFENSKNKLTFNSNGNKLAHAIRLLIKKEIITGFNLTDASKWVVSNFLYLNKRQKNIIEFKTKTARKTIVDGVECANPIIEIKNGKILKKDN